ncbi:transposable element Tc1 transposase [Trichonephila clavipes]|uniref:Transposable element Tc1 transposase n=1 Tax=Trichonephila clavipes TaxID=2585209 RepID=A0A8X6VAZ4_TRICX|nr:transposable element Tc1 transposase [Trichonephila clavipes]
MDDNARPHRAGIVEEYLEDHGLERMEWAARSQDLNPIKYLWDYLGREVAALTPPKRSLHELKQGLLCVWSSPSIPVSDNLINSMGNRRRQCIQTSSAIKRNHRRRLTEVGLRSRRPLRRLPLTPHHRQCRLDFCRTRATWSVTDWRRVIFSDESRFSLSADYHRTRVWRRTVVLQGTLTARRYVDDILTPIVLPMLSSHPGAIYQQDNARPHTARLSQQCLQGYDVLPWPTRSPDLSPIENVWDALGRQLQPSRDT